MSAAQQWGLQAAEEDEAAEVQVRMTDLPRIAAAARHCPRTPALQGFDGSRFRFHGVPGNWYEVLGSKVPDMSLRTQVGDGQGFRT